MKVHIGRNTLDFDIADDEDVENLWEEWKDEPLVIHPQYMVRKREDFNKKYPLFEEFKEKWQNTDDIENLIEDYASRMFPKKDDPKKSLDNLISNVVYEEENYVIIRKMMISEPSIAVNQNYGETLGKIILAEELGGHVICEAMQLRKFEVDLQEEYEKQGRDFDLIKSMTDLQNITYVQDIPRGLGFSKDNKKLFEEARRAQTLSSAFGVTENVAKYFPENLEAYYNDLNDTLEAGASYIRMKTAINMLGEKDGASMLYSSGGAKSDRDPLYFRIEEKIKQSMLKKGLSEEDAQKHAESATINRFLLPGYPTKRKLMPEIYNIESDIERAFDKEKKMRLVELGIGLPPLLGIYAGLGGGPLAFNAAYPGVLLPAWLGARTFRRVPSRVKRHLEDSERPIAKKLLNAGGKVKKPFSYAGGKIKENEYMIKFGQSFKSGAKKAGGGIKKGGSKMKDGLKWTYDKMYFWKPDENEPRKVKEKFTHKIDKKFNKSSKWNKFKKAMVNGYGAIDDAYQVGMIPLPRGRVLDLYGYGDNKWIKRKYNEEKIRDSFDDITGYLSDFGVNAELLADFEKYKDKIKILDSKEVGTSRGVMRLVPKYISNEDGTIYKRKEKS